MKRVFCLFWLVFFVFPVFIQQAYAQPHYVPGKILVHFKPGVMSVPKGLRSASVKDFSVGASSVRTLNETHGVIAIKQLYTDALQIRPDWKHLADNYVISFSADNKVESVARDYVKDANVLSASPVSVVQAFETTPNDPGYINQYGLVNMMAPSAWDRTTGAADSIIAVIDTGVDYNHEDLVGKIDTVHMKDLRNSDNDPMDDNGHGTSVAGVIGAVTNNSKGIAGVDWQAQILPIKVLASNGYGDMSTVAEGLAYITALKSVGVNIVAANMSLGQYNDGVAYGADPYVEENPNSLKDRCQEAYDQGIVLVAAAGNGDVNWNTYPAYYSTVLAVSAVTASDRRAVWSAIDTTTGHVQASNYGSWVDVAAPGNQIYSTYLSNTYVYTSGTSLASPFVAGLAGLVKASNSALTARQIMDKITSEADDIDALNPGYVGQLGKRINGSYILSRAIATISSPASGAYIKGTVPIEGTAAGYTFTDYRLEALASGVFVATVESSPASIEAGVLGDWDTTGLDGDYTLLLSVGSTSSSKEVSVEVVVDNSVPVAQISSPSGVGSIGNTITITGTGYDKYIDHYTLEYGLGSVPTAFEEILTVYRSVSGESLGVWETEGLNGTYLLRLRVVDLAGTTSTDSVVLTMVNSSDPNKVAVATAGLPLTYPVPNPFNMSITAECSLNYSLAGNFDTKIYLFDFSGKLVWQHSYSAGTNGGKSEGNNPVWDGLDLTGARVNKGLYFYQVVADGKVIARGKIILIN